MLPSQLNPIILQGSKSVSLLKVLVILTVLQSVGAVGLIAYFFEQQTNHDRSMLLLSTTILGLSAIGSALSALLNYITAQQQAALSQERHSASTLWREMRS